MIRFPVGHMAPKKPYVFVDRPIQSQFAHQLVHGTDASEPDRSGSFRYLVMDVGISEHGIGLILVGFSSQPNPKILLVTKVCFVVSFVHLKCAPLGL